MADIVSAQAGNWTDTDTWVGGIVPGIGTTALVKHAVTVDDDTIIGTSPAAGNYAVAVDNYNGGCAGSLTIAAGKTLTCKGDLWTRYATVTLGEDGVGGATLRFDSSGAGGTPMYRLKLGSDVPYPQSLSLTDKLLSYGTAGADSSIAVIRPAGADQAITTRNLARATS